MVGQTALNSVSIEGGSTRHSSVLLKNLHVEHDVERWGAGGVL